MESFVLHYITAFTYFGIFAFLMLTVFGFPFPEDAVLLLSGAVASQGITAVAPTLTIAYSGVIVGDFMLYFIGRRYGRRIVHHEKFGKFLPPEKLKKIGGWFHKWGNPLIFYGRHLVGFRAQILLCAGVFKLPFKRVLIYDSISAVISVPLMVGLGYLFGKNLPLIRERVATGNFVISVSALGLLALWAVYYFYKKRKAKLS
jgi:membrane protein DedA with SNARE-associated domain